MVCENCNNPYASRMHYSSGKCHCEKCGQLPAFKFSDVYFRQPYFDENIAHPDKSPLGTHIQSREHKAFMMKQYGLGERGDKRHGAL